METAYCFLYPSVAISRERTPLRELAQQCPDFLEARLLNPGLLTKEELEHSPENGKTIGFSLKSDAGGDGGCADIENKVGILTLSEKMTMSRSLEVLFDRVVKLEQAAIQTTKRAQVYEALGSNQFMSMADLFELVLAVLDHFFRANVQHQVANGDLDGTLSGLPFRSCSVDDVSYTACLQHWNKKKDSRNLKILNLMDMADDHFFEETTLHEPMKHWLRTQLLYYQVNIKQSRNIGAHVFSTILVHVKDIPAVRSTSFQYSFGSVPYKKSKNKSQTLLKLEVLKDISMCLENHQLHSSFLPMSPLLLWVVPWVEGLLRAEINGEQEDARVDVEDAEAA